MKTILGTTLGLLLLAACASEEPRRTTDDSVGTSSGLGTSRSTVPPTVDPAKRTDPTLRVDPATPPVAPPPGPGTGTTTGPIDDTTVPTRRR